METHDEFIKLPFGYAWISGVPDTCEHDYADEVLISKSGKVIHWHTYRQWARYTSNFRSRLIHEYHNQIDDPIIEGTSECRKCKKIFHPPMF